MSLVFITGAGKRIGRHLALEFAKAGWDIAVCYNSSKEGAEQVIEEILSLNRITEGQNDRMTEGTSFDKLRMTERTSFDKLRMTEGKIKAISVKADVRRQEEIENAFKLTIDNLGIPDVLINNAGVFPDKKKLDEINLELWDDTMNINLRAAFLCSKEFSNYAKKGSRIINISSLGGLEVWNQRIPYNVSKAGLNQLTKALARELAPEISVNAVCPGAIFVEDEPSDTDKTLLDINKIPMKRLGTPNDLFDAVYFFATCSDYITGQILTVDGGYHDAR